MSKTYLYPTVIIKLSAILILWVFASLSVMALAHDETAVPKKLLVGTMR
jgi:hypothetical protein